MMDKKKQIVFTVIPIAILAVAMIYLINENLSKTSNNENSGQVIKDVIETTENSSDNIQDESATEDTSNQAIDNATAPEATLIINENRCRGCGRCAQIDPNHFQLTGRTATVISQENLNSSSLNQAISSCPADAISLN